jgi:hypothetical protein
MARKKPTEKAEERTEGYTDAGGSIPDPNEKQAEEIGRNHNDDLTNSWARKFMRDNPKDIAKMSSKSRKALKKSIKSK